MFDKFSVLVGLITLVAVPSLITCGLVGGVRRVVIHEDVSESMSGGCRLGSPVCCPVGLMV
eukprot:12164207-Prorocentrum_lima.AAC.1